MSTYTMSVCKQAQKLRTTAAAWPTDPFRPNMQLKNFLESLATHPRLTPNAVHSARVLLDNGVQHRVSASLPVPAAVLSRVCSTRYLKRHWSRRRCPNTMNVWSKGTREAHRASDDRGGRSFSASGDNPSRPVSSHCLSTSSCTSHVLV